TCSSDLSLRGGWAGLRNALQPLPERVQDIQQQQGEEGILHGPSFIGQARARPRNTRSATTMALSGSTVMSEWASPPVRMTAGFRTEERRATRNCSWTKPDSISAPPHST